MKMLFEEVFRPEDVMVKRYGNVLSPTASVQAIDFTELRRNELDHWVKKPGDLETCSTH